MPRSSHRVFSMFALLEAGSCRVFACSPKARMLESRFFTHFACLRELLGVFVSPVFLFGYVLVLFFQGPGYSQCEPKAYDSTLPCGRLCCHTGCPTLLGLTCGLTAALASPARSIPGAGPKLAWLTRAGPKPCLFWGLQGGWADALPHLEHPRGWAEALPCLGSKGWAEALSLLWGIQEAGLEPCLSWNIPGAGPKPCPVWVPASLGLPGSQAGALPLLKHPRAGPKPCLA